MATMRSLLALLAIAASGLARADIRTTNPSVTIKNGTLIGSSNNTVDSFIGIPYAKPPINDLRFRSPQAIDQPLGVVTLPSVAPACIQQKLSSLDTTGMPAEAVPLAEAASNRPVNGSSEDCLTLSVQRPAGLSAGEKLPVLVWIHGGGWSIGASQWYDGSAIIRKSINISQPIIFVALNYRLNAFGFLQGKELQEDGSTNLGLRDQRKAFEWVAENIAAFGGDPDKVTIWGHSAGGISVWDHLTINNGDHTYRGKPLFRAGIINSGGIVRTLPVDSDKAQKVFNQFSTAAGCAGSDDILACLRQSPSETLVDAMNTLPNFYGPSANNLAFIRRTDTSSDFFSQFAEEAAAQGTYARVPLIAGTLEDDATIFAVAQRDIINSTETLVDFMATWYTETDRQLVADLIDLYPDDPAAGLPAGTGSLYELYPQFKRLALLQTDATFSQQRRELFSRIFEDVPVWGYLGTYLHGAPQFGTYHTTDMPTQFSLRVNPFTGNAMDTAYINFIYSLDPNGKTCEPWWPQWNDETLQIANFSSESVGLTKDDFRWESYEFLREHTTKFRHFNLMTVVADIGLELYKI
jgi:carboxylesterase type B